MDKKDTILYIDFISLRDQRYQHKNSDWTLQG